LVAAEQTIDLMDATGFVWGVADDAPNTRVKVTPPSSPVRQVDRSGGVQINNSAAETTIATLTIPAGALLGNSMARALLHGLFFNNTGAVQNYAALKVYVNGTPHLSTGSIAGGGGVASRGAFYGYHLEVDVESNGNNNQFLNMSLLGAHAGSAALGGDFLAGFGGWSSVAQAVMATGRTAAPAENAANPIVIQVTAQLALASPNLIYSCDVGTLEIATH
jgi:hypothetical protein